MRTACNLDRGRGQADFGPRGCALRHVGARRWRTRTGGRDAGRVCAAALRRGVTRRGGDPPQRWSGPGTPAILGTVSPSPPRSRAARRPRHPEGQGMADSPGIRSTRRRGWAARTASRLALAALLGVADPVAAHAGPADQGKPVIVRLEPGSDPDAQARAAAARGARVTFVYRDVFPGYAAVLPPGGLRGIEGGPGVVAVDPDTPVRLARAEQPADARRRAAVGARPDRPAAAAALGPLRAARRRPGRPRRHRLRHRLRDRGRPRRPRRPGAVGVHRGRRRARHRRLRRARHARRRHDRRRGARGGERGVRWSRSGRWTATARARRPG